MQALRQAPEPKHLSLVRKRGGIEALTEEPVRRSDERVAFDFLGPAKARKPARVFAAVYRVSKMKLGVAVTDANASAIIIGVA